jgi:hypothetical protein
MLLRERLEQRFLSIDVHDATNDLDAISWKANYPLDQICPMIRGKLENHNISAFGRGEKQAPVEYRRAQKDRVPAISISPFLHQRHIADQKRWLHGSTWNLEHLVNAAPKQ